MTTAVDTKTNLQELAEFVVARALLNGASDAEVTIRQGDEFSTTVRMGEVVGWWNSAERASASKPALDAASSTR